MVIGIDHGNSQVKTIHAVFPSGIAQHGAARPSLPTDTLFYNGNYYTITAERESYKKDKTQDEKCFIMTLFGIAKEIIATNKYSEEVINVTLAVGLPPEHYPTQKDSFKQYFFRNGNDWEFKFNDKSFKVHLENVYVFPQAWAAAATKPSFLKEYSTTYVIDIGGYTVDVLLLKSGRADMSCCHSFDLGIIPMSARIINRINTERGTSLRDDHIVDVLTGRKTILEEEDKEYIKKAAEDHVRKIMNTLQESSINLLTDPAIFIGGGALILQSSILASPAVKSQFVEFFPDISANASGYTSLAEGMIRRGQQQNAN